MGSDGKVRRANGEFAAEGEGVETLTRRQQFAQYTGISGIASGTGKLVGMRKEKGEIKAKVKTAKGNLSGSKKALKKAQKSGDADAIAASTAQVQEHEKALSAVEGEQEQFREKSNAAWGEIGQGV